jgi:dihydrofolate reductase
MSNSVLFMSTSLDGFIAGPNDGPGNPGGDDFMRLHEWYGFKGTPPNTKATGWGEHFMDEINATGAVLAGRRTVEQVDHWGGNAHGVPIFVPSHRPPDPSVAKYPLVTYVADGIESAMQQAKAAAGETGCNGTRRLHGTKCARGRCTGRTADSSDPGAIRRRA